MAGPKEARGLGLPGLQQGRYRLGLEEVHRRINELKAMKAGKKTERGRGMRLRIIKK